MAIRVAALAAWLEGEVLGNETLLIDRPVLERLLPAILDDLIVAGCEIRGDGAVQGLDARVKPASEADWTTEYLAPILSVRAVDGVDGAIDHIGRYGSHHTEAIITEDAATAERAFMHSAEHRANILEPHYRRVGIATAGDAGDGEFFVQEFTD